MIQLGALQPDEVFQSLEPAYSLAHGYGQLAWEWHVGLRNWVVPTVYAGVLSLCSALGIDHPIGYRSAIAVLLVLLHAFTLRAVYRMGKDVAGRRGGWVAMLAVGLFGMALRYAGRTLSETISTSFLILAIEALNRHVGPFFRKSNLAKDETPPPNLEKPHHPDRTALLAGVWLGMAVVTRYSSLAFIVTILGWLFLSRRWRTLALVCVGGAIVGAMLGIVDKITWGSPFHSMIYYFRYALSDEPGKAYGTQPARFYLVPLLLQIPLWTWIALPVGWLKARPRVRAQMALPLVCVALYLLAIWRTPHKEVRFLYPPLMLLTLAGAIGLAVMLRDASRRIFVIAMTIVIASGLATYFYPVRYRGDLFHATIRTTRPASARGLLIVGEHIWNSGGYFYMGKNIPLAANETIDMKDATLALTNPIYNRALLKDGVAGSEALAAAGFTETGREGMWTIWERP